jgi:hypothetical protein
MLNEACRGGPNQAVFFILHPALFIQAAFFDSLPEPDPASPRLRAGMSDLATCCANDSGTDRTFDASFVSVAVLPCWLDTNDCRVSYIRYRNTLP